MERGGGGSVGWVCLLLWANLWSETFIARGRICVGFVLVRRNDVYLPIIPSWLRITSLERQLGVI